MKKILLLKCQNCGEWGEFSHDPECECRARVYRIPGEDGSPYSGDDYAEMTIDLSQIAALLEKSKKKGRGHCIICEERCDYCW